MKAVIMAGGKGTRIAHLYGEIPKPMIPVLGKPVLEYQVEALRSQGITDVLMVIGHLGHMIKAHFGDGSRFGVSISYFEEDVPLGTAGALYFLRDVLREDFLLVNGDVIFDIDIRRLVQHHQKNHGLATILTHPNNHPYDSAIIETDEHGKVVRWLHKEEARAYCRNRVNAGIHIISPGMLQKMSGQSKCDLDRDLLKPMIQTGQLYVYDSPEYVKDMGVPERLREVERDLETGLVQAKNLRNKQKAVFLDRDGTINKYVGFLRSPDQFELIEGIAARIREVNEAGFLAIVVTNQPVIARGEVDWEGLGEIHNKMETLLGNEGAYLDAIYVCPHHPDKGFDGERIEYKVDCNCRKPKPGLLLQAARDYNIDLQKSYMVGDSRSDELAGNDAGCEFMDAHTFLIDGSYWGVKQNQMAGFTQ
jgi:D-glycero-D-manno-heptose 1,7-bisphosphate phosphatase